MNLGLVLHAHQPPGNFDRVFRRGWETSYGPVLDLIEERPALRLSMHWSGPLLEWTEEHLPERIAQVRRMVERGQVEPVAAGMYEPVLALLPHRDRVGQVRAHRAYLRRLFGTDTHVAWLTERVWEPSLAADLVDAGIEAIALDDRHLLSAGLSPDDLDAPFLTESLGKPLLVAPAVEDLRKAVPWEPVDDALALIRGKAERGDRLLVYADDLEMFGMWPGTYREVIRGGWLARFFDGLLTLRQEAALDVLPLGEALARFEAERGPVERVYIPDGSYPEMLEWSLPVRGQRALAEVRGALDGAGVLDEASPFLRAGQYLQFLAKYPEVNHLHKRMLDVSERVHGQLRGQRSWDPLDLPEAIRELWRAQANCAYWHGLFGGAYLPHIRQRLWWHLLRAERAIEASGGRRQRVRRFDLDADRQDEVVITTDDLVVVVDPSEGAVVELSHRPSAVNLVDTMARREEAYHAAGGGDAPYPYDRGRRTLFVDRFLAPGPPPARSRSIEDLGDFEGRPYDLRIGRPTSGGEVVLVREGGAVATRTRVEKRLRITEDAPRVEAAYRVEALDGGVDARFGVELNFGLLFREQPHGMLHAGGKSFVLPRGGAARRVDECLLEMDGIEVRVGIEMTAADLDVRAVATVSRSESGFDRTLQELAVLLTWPVKLAPGDVFEPRIAITLQGAR